MQTQVTGGHDKLTPANAAQVYLAGLELNRVLTGGL